MRPPAERYLRLWAESFDRNLPPETAGLGEPEAREAVDRAMAAAWEELATFAATGLVVESRSVAQQEDREKRDRDRAERQRAEITATSAKVWRSRYGRHVADQLAGNAFTSFALVRVLDLEFAIPAERLEEFTAAVKTDAPATVVEDSGRRLAGHRLGTQADRLDAAAVEPALAAIAAERVRWKEERDQRAKARAQESAAVRERAEQERLYGAVVPTSTDDE
jgi:hypothetical protein